MATYSVARKLGVKALAAGVVDTVTISGGAETLEVYNRGANRLSFTYGGDGSGNNTAPATPVADADGNDHVEPGEALVFTSQYGVDVVKLISTAGTSYTVRGIPK